MPADLSLPNNTGMIKFRPLCFCVMFLILSGMPLSSLSALTVATWNIAWLGDGHQDEELAGNNRRGLHLRKDADYHRLRQFVPEADIVALQEVENIDAAHKVFMKDQWDVYISSRPTAAQWAQKMAVAVRKDKNIKVLEVSEVTLSQSRHLRRGIDLRIEHGDQTIRVLGIHLKSGCFGEVLSQSDRKACQKLAEQVPYLEAWIDARAREGVPFIIAGDWNRRLAKRNDELWADLDDGVPANLRLQLTTGSQKSTCWGGKYPEFIDHVVLGGPASQWKYTHYQIVYNEKKELMGKLSDHCPVVVVVRLISP